jgi:hypothetical protein
MTADTLKAAALILTFLGVIAIFAAWIQIWDSTWQAAAEPTRMSIFSDRMMKLSPCLRSWWHWRENGCRLI